jgi:hypothetical protein
MSQPEMAPTSQSRKEFRYERKFYLDQLDAQQTLGLIKRHPAMFSEIYPPRYINNIYFDHPLLDNYSDNIDGSPQRKKARVRWYHELFKEVENPILEFKIKNGLMGTKISFPFPGFSFQRGISANDFRQLINNSRMPPEAVAYLETVEPVLVNRYQRWYLATPNRAFRVTVDAGLTFFHFAKTSNQFLFRVKNHQDIVVELKYAREHDSVADRISSGFPFRMTRSSKYVQGIELVYH